ncbi:MAG TPA: J domain-containing protein [Candidatus Dormibacteraeota bacterium]|nr:J domain-containing protein [Candidatus Dormibacteraeota bacterium]
MVKGIFSSLSPGRRRAAAAAERRRLVDIAYGLHLQLQPYKDVAIALGAAGAAPPDVDAFNAEAAALAEVEILASVTLPPSARLDFNYYFLLGVTPRASVARIRTAYRRKAKEVHPDTHARDFAPGQWEKFMAVLTDVNDVLSDPLKRRAYDIFWRHRSRELAAHYRRPGERRGDWETRYLWEIAEMGEREEALATLVDGLAAAAAGAAERTTALQQLRQAVVAYETALVEIRTVTRGLPEHLRHFSERAAIEMQRKERLVKALRELLREAREAAGGAGERSVSEAALGVLRELRQAQHGFDLLHARSHL